MSFMPHLGLWILALSLSFNSPAVARPQPPPSTLRSAQSSDEEAVRALTERYGLAISAGDLETMRQLWDPQSPNLAARLKTYQGTFSNLRLDLTRMSVTRLEVTGDKAVSHLTTDDRQLDKETGAVLTERDAYQGACRSFEWVTTGSGWKIEREVMVQEDLAARLEAAPSEPERDELLEKEKAFVTEALVGSLMTRGQRHRIRGEYDAALRCHQLQQEVAEKIGDQCGIAGAWLEIGLTKKTQDDYEQALLFEQRSLALFEAAGLQRGVPLVLENLSHLYFSLGDYRQAFEYAQRSLRLYEEANHRKGTVEALFDLAAIYGDQNNFQQALAYLERALAIAQGLGNKIQIAILRREMAKQYAALGNYDRAREIYLEILRQTEGFGDQGGAAMIRTTISDLCVEQGRYSEALEYCFQALSSFEALSYKGGILETLYRISQIYLAEGKYAEALPPAEQATALARQMGQQMDLRVALTDLGYCQLGLNHPAEARQSFAEAISILEKLRAQTAGGAEERERYFEGRLLAHQGMFSLLVKENQPREALAFAERTKGRVLLDVLENGRVSIQKAMTPEEQQQERRLKLELTLLNRQLTHASQSDKPDPQRLGELTPRLKKARLDYEAFQTSLYAAHPELKINRGEAPIIKTEELAALLPDAASALLEYVVTDDQSYLFAITKAPGEAGVDVQLYRLPIKRAELTRQTEAFRQELAGRDLGFRASAVKLYELLLKPAQAQLKGKTNLVIVPDDKLWELPFQALLTSEHRFLIEGVAIAYAPSLTVLREMTRRPKNQHEGASLTLLALGNPTVGKQTIERATLALRDDLTPLPEAEQEVKALGHLYGAAHSKVYIGPEAREDRVKKEAGQASILHFATHGTLNNASPMYSHLVLAQGSTNEDGLLEAWEITQLDLKADLAILSACETARGRYSAGEGMIGLTWAMFVAGVPATVVSQWKVETASTRDLLVSFHRGLHSQPGAGKAKTTKAEALRHAALRLMRNPQTSHPFYWAGFVLVGDGR
jgi:CHAT domain-containing protein/lipopolysaccharide biosynthesis regulator YciM